MKTHTPAVPASTTWTCDRCGASKKFAGEAAINWNTLWRVGIAFPAHLCPACSSEAVKPKAMEWRQHSITLLELTEPETVAIHEFVIGERRKVKEAEMVKTSASVWGVGTETAATAEAVIEKKEADPDIPF